METKVLASDCCNRCANRIQFYPLSTNPICVHCIRVMFIKEDRFEPKVEIDMTQLNKEIVIGEDQS